MKKHSQLRVYNYTTFPEVTTAIQYVPFYDFPYTSTYTHMDMNAHISYVHGHAHLHTCINIKHKWGVTSHGGSTNFLEIFQVSIKRSKLWGTPKHCSYHNTKADWDCARFCDGACLFVFEHKSQVSPRRFLDMYQFPSSYILYLTDTNKLPFELLNYLTSQQSMSTYSFYLRHRIFISSVHLLG